MSDMSSPIASERSRSPAQDDDALSNASNDSQLRDPQDPPAGNPSLDMDNESESESDLSDIDEAIFDDFDESKLAIDRPAIPVDEDTVNIIGVHKRKRDQGDGEERKKKPKKSRRDRTGRREKPAADGDALDGDKPRKKRREREHRTREPKAREEAPIEEITDPEILRMRALDKMMDEALKNPGKRRRKQDGIDLEGEADEIIEDLRARMVAAVQLDQDEREAGRPAMAKLKLLPEVTRMMNRRAMQNYVLDPDTNFMTAIKFFLEPLRDGSLPAYNIQRDILEGLMTLKISEELLRASGIAKVMLFYTKSKKPEIKIKRMAEKLVGEWSRPILKTTDDYRKRQIRLSEYDEKSSQATLAVRSSQYSSQKSDDPLAPVKPSSRARMETGPMKTYAIAPVNKGLLGQTHARRDDDVRRAKAILARNSHSGR